MKLSSRNTKCSNSTRLAAKMAGPNSMKGLVDIMMAGLHSNNCQDCTEIELLCHIFGTLQKKLTDDELRKIFVLPAAHFDRTGYLMGVTVCDDAKKVSVKKLERKSIAAIVKCMNKYASDACVQIACCAALHLATSEAHNLMQTFWSEGACGAILASMDVLIKKKDLSKALPRGYPEGRLFDRCCLIVRTMYCSSKSEPGAEPGLLAVRWPSFRKMPLSCWMPSPPCKPWLGSAKKTRL
jgi:hypothetical protein